MCLYVFLSDCLVAGVQMLLQRNLEVNQPSMAGILARARGRCNVSSMVFFCQLTSQQTSHVLCTNTRDSSLGQDLTGQERLKCEPGRLWWGLLFSCLNSSSPSGWIISNSSCSSDILLGSWRIYDFSNLPDSDYSSTVLMPACTVYPKRGHLLDLPVE